MSSIKINLSLATIWINCVFAFQIKVWHRQLLSVCVISDFFIEVGWVLVLAWQSSSAPIVFSSHFQLQLHLLLDICSKKLHQVWLIHTEHIWHDVMNYVVNVSVCSLFFREVSSLLDFRQTTRVFTETAGFQLKSSIFATITNARNLSVNLGYFFFSILTGLQAQTWAWIWFIS